MSVLNVMAISFTISLSFSLLSPLIVLLAVVGLPLYNPVALLCWALHNNRNNVTLSGASLSLPLALSLHANQTQSSRVPTCKVPFIIVISCIILHCLFRINIIKLFAHTKALAFNHIKLSPMYRSFATTTPTPFPLLFCSSTTFLASYIDIYEYKHQQYLHCSL